MRRKIDKSLLILIPVFVVLFFVALFPVFSNAFAEDSSAEENSDIFSSTGENHITIFDGKTRISLKTDALTVSDVLDRANIQLLSADSVEPSLDTEINADNFFINIYRSHPALVVDGMAQSFIMTSSFDSTTIATEAGFSIYDGDKIIPTSNANFLELGLTTVYTIIRGLGSTLTVSEEIPFAEQKITDYSLPAGKSELISLGEVGQKTTVYKVQTKNGIEVSREIISETTDREPVARVVKVGADPISMHPLTASMGRNRYTVTMDDGRIIERQETFYDLPMSLVMKYRLRDGCGDGTYTVREDGVKVDNEGYILVAANLDRYPLCSIVQTSLGAGKVYDTGTFATSSPEQFDIATDWTNKNGV